MMKPHHLPLRLIAGAYIVNSGLSKLGAEKETAAALHGFASTAYPFLQDMDPQEFTDALAKGEIALGVATLFPFVPSAVAGAGLAAFSTGLIGLYLKVPGMREPGSLRPTQAGIPLAKDSWLFGIGLSLVLDEMAARRS